MYNFLMLLMNNRLLYFCDIFLMNNRLMVLMHYLLMVLMNNILMMFMNHILMLFMNYILMMLLYNWFINMSFYSGCWGMLFDRSFFFVDFNFRFFFMFNNCGLFKALFNNWLLAFSHFSSIHHLIIMSLAQLFWATFLAFLDIFSSKKTSMVIANLVRFAFSTSFYICQVFFSHLWHWCLACYLLGHSKNSLFIIIVPFDQDFL